MNVKSLVRQCVLDIKPYKPGKPIEEVKRELDLKTVYKMASNENALGPSPKAMRAIKKALPGINRYPDGSCFYLKKALAKKYRLRPENIIVGNGSDELFVLAMLAFIEPGDEVIVAEPTFLMYKLDAQLFEARVVSVPLKAFRYDLAAMKAKITSRTKLVFIANPDNPTGSYVTRKEVEQFLKDLPDNVIVIFDEAYFEYVEACDYGDCLRYLNRGNVIVCRTFSKAYGLCGLRVGWAAGSREIIAYMNQVRDPFNVNQLAQVAAEAALTDTRHVEKSRRLVSDGRKYIYAELKAMDLFFVPSVTNFILINIGPESAAVYEKLLRRGIIVREMTAWGLPNFLRVTIGTKKENQLFVKALKTILFSKKGA